MAWPYDEEEIPQVGQAGGADWLSTIPMLLGAAGSFYNPQAGAAVMGMGDYMRRQRMAELSAERYQQQVANQQRMYQLQQQRLQEEQRRQALVEQRRRGEQGAISQTAALHQGMYDAPDLNQVGEQLTALSGQVESPAARAAFDAALKDYQAVQGRESEAALTLGQYRQAGMQGPTRTGGNLEEQYPAELTPERYRELIVAARRGGFKATPESLAALQLDPLRAPGGAKYVEERAVGGAAMSKAVLDGMLYDTKAALFQNPALGNKLSTDQRILLALDTQMSSTPALVEQGARMVDPTKTAGELFREGRAREVHAATRQIEAAMEGAKVAGATPAYLAREAAEVPIAARRAAAVSSAQQPYELEKIRQARVPGETAQKLAGAAVATDAANNIGRLMETPEVRRYQGPLAQWLSEAQRMAPGEAAGKIPAERIEFESSYYAYRNYITRLNAGLSQTASELANVKAELPKLGSHPDVFKTEFQTSERLRRKMEHELRKYALGGDRRAQEAAAELGLFEGFKGPKPEQTTPPPDKPVIDLRDLERKRKR